MQEETSRTEQNLNTNMSIQGVNSEAYKQIQTLWQLNPTVEKQVAKAVTSSNSRYGLMSNVPIKCKGMQCPYIDTCTVDLLDLPNVTGNRCPIEIATLLTRFEKYCHEFDVTEDMTTDMGQIKELVDLELMILRCDAKMAASADFVEESLVDVTKQGIDIYEKKVTPEAEFKMTLYERHSKILKSLNADRASKKEINGVDNASKAASIIMQRIKEVSAKCGFNPDDALDVEYSAGDDECIITEEQLEQEQNSYQVSQEEQQNATDAQQEQCEQGQCEQDDIEYADDPLETEDTFIDCDGNPIDDDIIF